MLSSCTDTLLRAATARTRSKMLSALVSRGMVWMTTSAPGKRALHCGRGRLHQLAGVLKRESPRQRQRNVGESILRPPAARAPAPRPALHPRIPLRAPAGVGSRRESHPPAPRQLHGPARTVMRKNHQRYHKSRNRIGISQRANLESLAQPMTRQVPRAPPTVAQMSEAKWNASVASAGDPVRTATARS